VSELHRAVQAEIDAHTPTSVPPFSAVRDRKRRRDRRNVVAAGAALAVVGLVVGFGLVPELGGDDARDSVIADGPDSGKPVAVRYAVTWRDRGAYEGVASDRKVQGCARLPGARPDGSTQSVPPQISVLFSGTADEQGRLRACLEAVDGASVRAFSVAADTPPTPAAAAYARPHECPDGDTSVYDAVPFLMVGDQMYLQRGGASRTTRLGPRLFDVVCSMRDGAPNDGYENQGGDAAFLSAGTPVHEVVGFDPAFRVAATYDGQVVLFEADRRETARTGAEVFPGVAEHVVAITVLSAQDAKTVIAREDDPAKVREMTTELMASPNGSKANIAGRDVFVGLVLDDGTTVARAYLSREGVLQPGLTVPTGFRNSILDMLRATAARPAG
jgi:hypothetical protein